MTPLPRAASAIPGASANPADKPPRGPGMALAAAIRRSERLQEQIDEEAAERARRALASSPSRPILRPSSLRPPRRWEQTIDRAVQAMQDGQDPTEAAEAAAAALEDAGAWDDVPLEQVPQLLEGLLQRPQSGNSRPRSRSRSRG